MLLNKYHEYAPKLIEQLSKGAFLTTTDGDNKNTMTIGWATIGRIWNKPMLVVAVRYSRHTYKLLEKNKYFTVSVPRSDKMKEELKLCGTKSGKNLDKFVEYNLAYQEGKTVDVPVLSDCAYHFECRVAYQQAMEPVALDEELKAKFYQDDDYHVLYYGEILASIVFS